MLRGYYMLWFGQDVTAALEHFEARYGKKQRTPVRVYCCPSEAEMFGENAEPYAFVQEGHLLLGPIDEWKSEGNIE